MPFASAAAWEAWLAEHHADPDGLWIRFAKKASGIPTVVYKEAVHEALRYGWIDGQVKRLDDDWYVQRFTPRRARSRWSKINCAKAEALIASGAMQPAGLAEVERAKADGRWDAAYDAPSTATVPDDLRAALDARPGGERVLRDARRQQPLRDPAPHPGREEARDAGAPDREVRGDARPRRDDLTRRAARPGSGASSCGRRTRPSSTSGASRCGCGRGIASCSYRTASAARAGSEREEVDRGDRDRPQRAVRMTARPTTQSPRPRSSPRGRRPRARRGVTAARPRGGSLAGRHRGEHVRRWRRAAPARAPGRRRAAAPAPAARPPAASR